MKKLLFLLLIVPALTFAVGQAGSQLAFDGLDDVVQVAFAPVLNTLSGDYTLETWFNRNAYSNYDRLADRENVFAFYLGPNNTVGFRGPLGSPELNSPNNTVTAGWHHVAVRCSTVASVVTATLFYDGNPVASLTHPSLSLPTDQGTDLFLGNRSTLDRPLNGGMDEVRLWNIARTNEQIKKDRGAVLTGAEPGLIAYYKLDDGPLQLVVDATVQGVNGRLGVTDLVDGTDPLWQPSGAAIGFNLSTPNVATVLPIASALTITWAVNPELAQINVLYSSDSGASWSILGYRVANTGSLATYVPGVATTHGLFRVAHPDSAVLLDDSDHEMTFLDPGNWKQTIIKEAEEGVLADRMQTSVDGRAFECGFVFSKKENVGTVSIPFTVNQAGLYVIWGRTRAVGGSANSIYWSMDGGAEKIWDTQKRDRWIWETLADRGTSSGYPDAEVKPVLLNLSAGQHTLKFRARETHCRLDQIRITNDLAARISASPAKWIELVSPHGWEQVPHGSTFEIKWSSSGIGDKVSIEYSTERTFKQPVLITDQTANDGSYLWQVPNENCESAHIRVTAGNPGDCPADQNHNEFAIIDPPPQIIVQTPNGGETWQAASSQQVGWISKQYTGLVHVCYSLDNGKNWNTLAENQAASDTIQWTLPATLSDSCLIRVAAAGSGTPSDQSDSVFAIISKPPIPTENDFALYFDGVNDFVEIPNHASLNVSTRFTIEFWMKTSTPTQKWTRIMEKGSWHEYYMGFYGGGAKMSGALRTAIPGGSAMTTPVGPSTTVLAKDAWYHVAATFDGAIAKIYINGREESSKAATVAPRSLVNSLILGAKKSSAGTEYHYQGWLDEVRIWNAARSQSEIAATMYQTLTGAEANLVACFSFNEGAGQATLDRSANAHSGRFGELSVSDDADPQWVVSDRPTAAMPKKSEPAAPAAAAQPILPEQFALNQNYPNPFNAGTLITFEIPVQKEAVEASLEIYDLSGRRIAEIWHGTAQPGRHQATWNGLDANGQTAASGVYFYRLRAGQFSASKRMLMLK